MYRRIICTDRRIGQDGEGRWCMSSNKSLILMICILRVKIYSYDHQMSQTSSLYTGICLCESNMTQMCKIKCAQAGFPLDTWGLECS